MRQLFLSHATSDQELVDDVRRRLEAIGVSVYLAEHDVRAGENVHRKIARALDRSDAVIVLLSDVGYDSAYVHQEIGWAKSRGKLIVPVVTQRVARSGVGMLEGLEYIVVDEQDRRDALDRLDLRVRSLARQWQRDDTIELVVAIAAVSALFLAFGD